MRALTTTIRTSTSGRRRVRISPEEARRELAKRRQNRRQARTNLLDFTTHTMRSFRVNWHHRIVAKEMDDWIAGIHPRLIIVQPPRTGKTELVSRRAPAYIFGKDPDAQVIATSYAASLAVLNSIDVQNIIESREYQGVFPETKLYSKGVRNKGPVVLRRQDRFRIVGRAGQYLAAGVDGGIVGSGFEYGLVDDPVKGYKEAVSAVNSRKVWDWFWNDFMTRQASFARVCITTTRWTDHDLVGRLKEDIYSGLDELGWRIVRLEAEKSDLEQEREDDREEHHPDDPREPGEVLWEEKRGYFDQFRKRKKIWASAFQGKPTVDDGEIYSRSWFGRYRVMPPRFDYYLITGDTNAKGIVDPNDRTKGSAAALAAWGVLDGYVYLLDVECGRWGFLTLVDEVENFGERWKFIAEKLIEDKANGPAVVAILQGRVPGIDTWAVSKWGSKLQRALATSGFIKSGHVLVPHVSLLIRGRPASDWVEDYVDELCKWDGTDSMPNDRVDVTTAALIRLLLEGGIPLVGRGDETEEERQAQRPGLDQRDRVEDWEYPDQAEPDRRREHRDRSRRVSDRRRR